MTTATAPICPVHHRAMNTGKFGYYCSALDPSGPKGYCTQKVPFPKTEPQVNSAPPRTLQTELAPQLRVEALRFAASVMHGQGEPPGNVDLGLEATSINLARQALNFLSES